MKLTPTELDHFKTRVGEMLDEISRATAAAAANDMGTVILDQACVGRLSRMDALQQQAMAAGWQETLVRENRRLLAAWTRLVEGGYGVCCRCDEPIPKDRLEADPGAPFCAECQEALEADRASARR
ncbi:MAG: TraR/DksA family transcriptional regulator [Thiobacillus sp.]